MSEQDNYEFRSHSLDSLADSLNTRDLPTLLKNISASIRSHARAVGINRNPNILESRFMPPQEAFDKGILSCGVMANISSTMLKHLGYQVKLVHGEIPTTLTHAWIAVYNQEKDTWDEYDLTKENAQVTEDHKAKYIVDDWEEIRPEIENYYKSNHPHEDA